MPKAKAKTKAEPTSKPKKTPSSEDRAEIVKSLAEELLADLQVDGQIELSSETDIFSVKILPVDPNDTPLLIGYHGETVSSFQTILGMLVAKKVGEWVRIVVDVADYRDKRAEQLTAMAESFASQALSTNQPVYLPPLTPAERRVIHIALAERADIETFSEGEGRNRRLVIKPKETA